MNHPEPMPQVFVDRGGTFTDVVRIVPGGGCRLEKVPSDRAVIGDLARDSALTFGTTVATNALLERRGVPTLVIVSRGFEDLLLIRDMRRPDLFDPDLDWPTSLATTVLGIDDFSNISKIESSLPGHRAVVIALLGDDFASRERLLADHLRELAPDLLVVESHRLCPDPGYLARLETALVDAAITPHLLAQLQADRIPHSALAMRSDGGLVQAHALRAPDAILSGPAGGVLATLDTARRAGFRHAVGLDMGGTSTDVCLVSTDDGPTLREDDLEVAGVRLRRRMLEVETIAAGGGSILACEGLGSPSASGSDLEPAHALAAGTPSPAEGQDGLRMTVGPRSAGASPGPQCYGHGGPPTLTDAAVVAGLIDPHDFPLPLDPSRIALPRPRSTSEREAAEDYLRIAREAMAQAVTRLAMRRGVDLSDHALVAFGGAGGQHAAPVAERLGIRTVLVHPAASVFCAWGQTLAAPSETHRVPLWRPLLSIFTSLHDYAAALREALSSYPELTFSLELAHPGTDHALAIPYTPALTLADLDAAFHEAHRARFGFARDLPLEARALVATATAHAATPSVLPEVCEWQALSDTVGPCVIRGAATSVYVPAGWSARMDHGLLRLDALAPKPAADPTSGPLAVALWQSRFQAIAEEAGAALERLASSVSIKERLDFSCAVFDPEGRLVANAPHIPVHLGAMGETVRDIARANPPETTHDGDAWLTNDPAAGGSHLPDLTVVTAVHHDGTRFFVACRAHHVDVGGISPGSMPSRSRTLAEEGLRLRRVPLVTSGRLVDIGPLVAASRQADVVIADLEAQLAANAHLARRLVTLGPPDRLVAAMGLLHRHAAEATERLIATLPLTSSARDDLDGLPLALTLARRGHRLTLDFTGTGGPHPGNLNAPPAVVRAAVLYALRLAVTVRDPNAHSLPLNDGTLSPIDLIVPAESVLSPPADAAVVGGNVETSQRLVDLVLKALGLRAESAGSMSNLVLSGEHEGRPWAFYETLGGGYGATAVNPGRSARQTHMTNTRATDPEVLPMRLPLRVRTFSIRRGSGGEGRQRGGDGLIRELEVSTPAVATLLAAWRPGARGLGGGRPGAPGVAEILRVGRAPEPWDGSPIALEAGDRIRVSTPGGGGFGDFSNITEIE
jgi:5-oxoprolinase (ATP-hydrolysing)